MFCFVYDYGIQLRFQDRFSLNVCSGYSTDKSEVWLYIESVAGPGNVLDIVESKLVIEKRTPGITLDPMHLLNISNYCRKRNSAVALGSRQRA